MNKKTIMMYFGSPLYQAFFPTTIASSGMGNVVVTRKTAGDALVGVIFLCDHYCLGVKDCLPFYESAQTYRAMLQNLSSVGPLEEVSPGYAKKYIADLVAWSKAIGFFPCSDFRACSEILRGIEPDPTATFEFGHQGVPMYINGPHDTPQRIQTIVNTLEAYKARTGAEANYTILAADPAAFPPALGAPLRLP
jgi:hypothetical protein